MKTWGKRIAAVTVVLLTMLTMGLVRQKQAEKTVYTKDIFAMDTYFVLKAYGPKSVEALEQCEKTVRKLEADLSVTKEGSDIYRLNLEKRAFVSEHTFLLIRQALKLCEETEGKLDITLYPVLKAWGFTTDTYRVPDQKELQALLKQVDYGRVELVDEGMGTEHIVQIPKETELDLGAVAKGYTGDCLIEIMKKEGVTSGLVDLGGNVQALGTKPDGLPWRVALRNPLDISKEMGVLEINDKAVITSGSYERYFEKDGRRYWHILDPKDGCPADNGLVSVTVVGESGVRCDGLSTALFVMGKEQAVRFWQQTADFEMILVTEEGQLCYTEGLQESFTCGEGWHGEIIYQTKDEQSK